MQSPRAEHLKCYAECGVLSTDLIRYGHNERFWARGGRIRRERGARQWDEGRCWRAQRGPRTGSEEAAKGPHHLTAFTRGPGKGESTETESRPGAAGGCRGLGGKGRGDWLLTSAGLVLGW